MSETIGNYDEPKIQDGAFDLVNSISQSGLKIWIVTGSIDPALPKRLEEDFFGLISPDCIVTGNDFELGKPNPEPYIIGCAKSQCELHEALCIENAPLGTQSASEAGIFCVAVNTGPLSDEQLIDSGARAVFSNCNDLAMRWTKLMSLVEVEDLP